MTPPLSPPSSLLDHLAGSALLALLDAVDEGLLLLASDGHLLLANARFWDLFGVPPGSDISELRSHIAGCMADPEAYLASLAQEVDDGPATEVDLALVRPCRRVVRRRVAAVRGADGSTVGRLVSYRDITRDAEVNRLKTEFVANVSHELRTPMAAIKGFLTVVLEDEATIDPEQRRHFLGIAREQTDRLSRLIDDLLDISRIEAGRRRRTLSRFPVGELLRDLAQALRPELREAGLRLDLETAPTDWDLLADRDQIAQVLLNLLTNAVKFTPRGGCVRLAARRTATTICLRVEDSGIGIAAEDLPQVFEKFFRGRSSGVAPSGTGLGLAIARELVEGHGGRLTVRSAVGEGSCFEVLLPLEPGGAT
ncbi:MAG: PAS domain-containing protein [Fimbriimonadaceae bacterium]|nr:PAS domain-containing protein [Fimbriimonadaceae bacterium]